MQGELSAEVLNSKDSVAKGIAVTPEASSHLSELMTNDGKAGYGLKVGVKGGGCSGLQYELTFEKEPKNDEKIFESNGLRIFVDLKSYLYLRGLSLDFSGGLNGKGFVFSNPNAVKTCGCGTSFAA
ncbi:MAG: iron-sulfur cluster assembly accessory protein [Candidatus Marinimicrobia bacterium]|nr:iron-sulfur cluster assembly accessory protein [Candidatus Neomarinimicrobiota bacterium]MCH7954158.1 iron-sulfur cluster assembly accessory protein [Candidatus Neomarinimicrobiota bacterium]